MRRASSEILLSLGWGFVNWLDTNDFVLSRSNLTVFFLQFSLPAVKCPPLQGGSFLRSKVSGASSVRLGIMKGEEGITSKRGNILRSNLPPGDTLLRGASYSVTVPP